MRKDKIDKIVHARNLLIPKDKFLHDLDLFIAQIDELNGSNYEDNSFKLWKMNVGAMLIHAFGEHTTQYADFVNISYYNVYAAITSSNYEVDIFGNRIMDATRGYDAGKDFREGLQNARVHLTAIRDEVVKYFPCSVSPSQVVRRKSTLNSDNRKVFVVHGHDEALRIKVASVLRKLGLEPVILRDEPNKGRTIIEKFEENADVGFAVILLTADDRGYDRRKPDEIADRARQNVILEMGYFIGRYGRDKIMAICESSVERPGDISGVVYTDATNEAQWSFELVKELNAVGYNVDANKLL